MKEIQLNRLTTKAFSHQHLLAIPLRDADLLPPSLTRLPAAVPAMIVGHRWTRPVRLQASSTRTPPNPPSIPEARVAAFDHLARWSHGERPQISSPSNARPGLSFRARGATGTRRLLRYHGRFVVRLYNTLRPHMALGGMTPQEAYERRNRRRRKIEPRPRWPHRNRRRNVGKVQLAVSYIGGRKHLPVIELRRAA